MYLTSLPFLIGFLGKPSIVMLLPDAEGVGFIDNQIF